MGRVFDRAGALRWALAALVLTGGPGSVRSAAAQDAEAFVFTSGPEDSSYRLLAEALRDEVRRGCAGCQLRVVDSQGSYENAARLRTGEADVAILQSDVAFLEHFEDRSFRAVAPLFIEPIHILARRELGLERLSDLADFDRPLQVALGPDGSGSASNALTVLEELGPGRGRLELHRITLAESLERLKVREMDVVFVTAAPPVRSLRPAAREGIFNVLEIDGDLARRMARKYPFFTMTEIPYRAYGTRGRNVQTLGPHTVLVVGPRAGRELVVALLEGLERIALDARERGLPQLAEWSPGTGLADLPIPLHEAARAAHAERTSPLGRWLRRYRGYVLPILVLVTPLLVLLRFSRIAYFIHQFVLGRIFCMLVAVWLLGAAAMHLIEGAKNSSFRSFGQSAIAILHYLFSGLESKYPITLAGNVVAIVMLTLGVGIVTMFTATLVSLLVERALEVRKIREKPWRRLRLRDHVILVGWSDRAARVLAQLRSDDLPRKPVVVVVARGEGERPPETRRPYRDTWLVEGDIADDATLARADADRASCALVLSGEQPAERPDLLTVSRTFAVESFAPRVRTVAEVREPSSLEHLRRAGVDEVVETRELGRKLLCQAVVAPGITSVFQELLTFGKGSQELHLVDLPAGLHGKTFRELRRRLADRPVLPIGYRRQGELRTVVNPHPASGGAVTLGPGDRLLVVADEPRLRKRPRRLRSHPGAPRQALERPVARREDPRALRVGICDWTPEALEVAGTLRTWSAACGRDLSIVGFRKPGTDPPSVPEAEAPWIDVVTEDSRSRRGLERGGLADLDCLLILGRSGKEEGEGADHDSLLVALAASGLRPDLHLVVEILDPRSRGHFDRLPAAEVISVDEIAEKVLAQAAITPGITGVFTELLTATDDTNEIYLSPVPERWAGRSFQAVHEELAEDAEPRIVLGYRTRPEGAARPVEVLNPAWNPGLRRGVSDWRGHELAAGDDLIVLAYSAPVWCRPGVGQAGGPGSKRR